MAFVQFDTNDLIVPVMIPKAADPAVTGLNSVWLVAGAAALAWLFFGSKVSKDKPQAKSKPIRLFKGSKKKVAKKKAA